MPGIGKICVTALGRLNPSAYLRSEEIQEIRRKEAAAQPTAKERMESALRKWSADSGPVEFRAPVPECAPESRIGSSAVEEFRQEEKEEMQSANRDGKAFSEAPGSAHGASSANGRTGKDDFAYSDESRRDGD